METHLDFLLRSAQKETLEQRFLKAKKLFLIQKLSRIQEEIDSKKLNQDIGFLAMVLYVFDFVEKGVGKNYAEKVIDSLSFTNWNLKIFKPILEQKNFNEKITTAAKIFAESESARIRSDAVQRIAAFASMAWKELGLDKDFNDEMKKIVEEKKKLYAAIGSPADRERRDLVKSLTAKGGKKVPLKLLNIGVVLTELCPNECRFCLVPWKASVQERIGRKQGEEEFQKIVSQAIDFAAKRNLIVTITGGEPVLELERVLHIIRSTKSEVQLSTSAYWAGDESKTEKILKRINEAIEENKNPQFSFSIQLSCDAFHQEVAIGNNGALEENIPIANLANVIEVAQEKFPKIEICLLPKYSLYEDALVALLQELKNRGFDYSIESRKFDENFKVSIFDGTNFVSRPALLSANLRLKSEKVHKNAKPVFIFYTAIENIGAAAALESFEFPSFSRAAEEFLSSSSFSPLPLTGIEISDEGNVYPGAHALYSWSLGNVLETPLEEIINLAEYDPLLIALAENPARIKDVALKKSPGLAKELKKASSPLAAVYKILESAEMRLEITRKLITT